METLRHPRVRGRRRRRSGLGAALLLGVALLGCRRGPAEVRVQDARTGDLLVQVGEERVYLAKTFRPGVPNGLYDGGVRVGRPGEPDRYMEVNAVCSLPGQPGWPAYDNIYGRRIDAASEAGREGGDTHWQTLLPFEGAPSESGPEPSPAWAARLAQNLCRKGDFRDTPQQAGDAMTSAGNLP